MATTMNQTGVVQPALVLEKEKPPMPRRWSVGRFIAFLILVAIAVLWVVPFFWMLSTSLKTPQDLFNSEWVPNPIAWENYRDAFSFGMWGQWTLNTLIITAVSTVGVVLSSSLVAYAFARLRWPGRDFLFSIVLGTMMLPGIVTLIPQFILFAKLPAFGFQGSQTWINTFLPLTVPAFAGNAFYIFLLRQFMRGIPKELSDAARVDGASHLQIWWHIVMPNTKPAIAAITIFGFQGAWQDFMGPLIYLQSERLYTLQIGLRQYEFAFGGSPAWNWLMAANLLVMLPVLILFLMFQRYFIEGVTLTGMNR